MVGIYIVLKGGTILLICLYTVTCEVINSVIYEKEELELLNEATIQGVYADWSRTMPAGMHKIDGNYYLAVPNGWEGRLWWYEWWVGKHYWDGEAENKGIAFDSTKGVCCNERDRDRYHKQHQLENEYTMHDKLLIDFGKATNYETESWNREITATEVDTIFKVKIVASGTITFNLTKNDPNSPRKIVIDWGDGNSTETLTGSHTYTGNGPYIIRCYSKQGSTTNDNVRAVTNNYYELPNEWVKASSPSMIRCIAFNSNQCIVPKDYILNFSGMNMPILHLDNFGSMEKEKRAMLTDSTVTDVICWHKDRIAYIWLNNSSVTTYHTATNIDTIYIVGQNRVDYVNDKACTGVAAKHYTNSKCPTTVCVHSDRPINIYGYSYDRDFCEYKTPNVTFHVRSSIYSHMKEKYPMLTFTSW